MQAWAWPRGRQPLGNHSDVDRIHIGVVAYQLATGWLVIRLEGPAGGLEVVGSVFGSGSGSGAYRLSGWKATRAPSPLSSATIERPVLLLNLK